MRHSRHKAPASSGRSCGAPEIGGDDTFIGADFRRRTRRQMPAKIEHRHHSTAGEDGVYIVLDNDSRDPAFAD